MKQRKRLYGFLSAFAISTSGVTSAYALEIPIIKNTPLAQVFNQWQQQLSSLNYISSTLSRKLEPLTESLKGDLQAAVDNAIGVLGLPDSTETRGKVEDIAANSDSCCQN